MDKRLAYVTRRSYIIVIARRRGFAETERDTKMTVVFKKSEWKQAIAKAGKMAFADVATDAQIEARRLEAEAFAVGYFFKSLENDITAAKAEIAKLHAKLANPNESPAYALSWSLGAFEAAGFLEVAGRVQRFVESQQGPKTRYTVECIRTYLMQDFLLTSGSLSQSSSQTSNLIDRAKEVAARKILASAQYL